MRKELPLLTPKPHILEAIKKAQKSKAENAELVRKYMAEGRVPTK